MGLFSKKKSSSPSSSTKEATPLGSSASVKSELGLSSSNESIKSDISSGKIKGLLKKKLNGGGAGGAGGVGGGRGGEAIGVDKIDKLSADLRQIKLDKQMQNTQTSSLTLEVPRGDQNGKKHLSQEGHIPSQFKKRVSTIIENENNSTGDDSDDFDADADDDEGSNIESDSSDSELEEDHLHPIKPKYDASHHDLAQQLSTIMGYCGLRRDTSSHSTEEANKESQRTYSLLDQENRIKKLPKSVHSDESIIGEYQIQLIQHLTAKIERLITDGGSERLLTREKSLYQRYGVIRNVIGKGAYGLIKIIDPDGGKVNTLLLNSLPPLGKRLFVVKELPRRKDEKTNNFIERIMSEFVISSTLNSKYIIETVDLMGTLSPSSLLLLMSSPSASVKHLRISQVMNCSQGGDLFSYLLTGVNIKNKPVMYMSLYEVDCILKQVARGLKYMHAHGVSHCDLKLENILISYQVDDHNDVTESGLCSSCQCKMLIKLSDFGKSFVFRTAFDKSEQKLQGSQGIIGSEPYIAPEEYLCTKINSSYSSVKKDCWAFGVVALTLLNIRRSYYCSQSSNGGVGGDGGAYRLGLKLVAGLDLNGYSTGYLWKNTDAKTTSISKSNTSSGSIVTILLKLEYKDKVFNEYVKKRMIGDYDTRTKEWLIKQPGRFMPIENICKPITSNSDDDDTAEEEEEEGGNDVRGKQKGVRMFDADKDDEDEDDLSELRVLIIYKLLDIDPSTRMNMDQFLKSDWMTATESCF